MARRYIIAADSSAKKLKLQDPEIRNSLYELLLPGEPSSLAHSTVHNQIIVAAVRGAFRTLLIDAATFKLVAYADPCEHVDITSDGKYTAFGNVNLLTGGIGEVRLCRYPFMHIASCKGHVDSIDRLSFSPSGCRLISISHRSATVWQVPSMARAYDLNKHQNAEFHAAAFLSNSILLTSTCTECLVFWDVETGSKLKKMEVYDSTGHGSKAVVVSSSSKLIACCDQYGFLKVFNSSSCTLISTIALGKDIPVGFVFLDDTSLIVCAVRQPMTMYDVETGTVKKQYSIIDIGLSLKIATIKLTGLLPR